MIANTEGKMKRAFNQKISYRQKHSGRRSYLITLPRPVSNYQKHHVTAGVSVDCSNFYFASKYTYYLN
jgi:hypothetical protein